MSTLISRRAFARTLSLLPFASPAALPAFAFEEPEGLSIGPSMCLDGQGREMVSPSALNGRVLILMAGGQSNCSNTAGGHYVPLSESLWNFNIGDGKIYRAARDASYLPQRTPAAGIRAAHSHAGRSRLWIISVASRNAEGELCGISTTAT
jgi:hypothetical protein